MAAVLGADSRGDIALVNGDLERGALRSVLAWATLAGAAVLFEPCRASLLASVRWARPTVLLASAAVRAELLEQLLEARHRRLGSWRLNRLKGRLRAVVREELEDGAAEERSRWEAVGVALVTA